VLGCWWLGMSREEWFPFIPPSMLIEVCAAVSSPPTHLGLLLFSCAGTEESPGLTHEPKAQASNL